MVQVPNSYFSSTVSYAHKMFIKSNMGDWQYSQNYF
jgi:hypothetical protein